MRIDGERLNDNIQQLGEIGYRAGEGVTRLALGEEDMRARRWLEGRMQEAGLQVRTDAAANMIGRLPCGRPEADCVVIGSHLDTVPQGGRYDGALGVLAGLEVAQICRENGIQLPWDLEVINFTDEEGHHYAGTFGSRAMMEGARDEDLHRSRMEGVPTLAEDLRAVGVDPECLFQARRDPDGIRAYLELHIEQGSRMEEEGIDVAAVTGIVGIYRYQVTVEGEANHAGTTSMHDRDDALVKATLPIQLLPEWARARSDEMVATVGQVFVEPGAVNIIPARCDFTVELRSLESEDMARVRDRLHCWLAENDAGEMHTVFEKDGDLLDDELTDIIIDQGAAEDFAVARLPSGAGHDAQSFASCSVPTGMIFIPSRGGLSHCPEEYSEPEWVTAGGQVLLRSVLELARRDGQGSTVQPRCGD